MKNILVIDDELQLLQTMGTLLRLFGYAPILASTGNEGIEKLESNPVDLIICDVSLPDITGFDVLRFAKKSAKYTLLPFIIFTAFSDINALSGDTEYTADLYCTKPLSSHTLLEHIKRLLKEI